MADREKMIALVTGAHNAVTEKCIENHCTFGMSYSEQIETEADYLIANGVTVPELDGCEYCKEGSDGYRKMIGAFSIANPFHGNVWNIETCHCKPRQIYFCPMCGRKLPKE